MNQPNTKWFARVMGRELGPMTRECLLRMIKDGEITPDDEIRLANDANWSSAGSYIVADKQPDLVTLEPVVSTIAPLRIRRTNERVHRIRERALAARGSQFPGLDRDEAGFESDIDEPVLTDDPLVDSDEMLGVVSDAVHPQERADVALESQPVVTHAPAARGGWSLDALFQGVGRAVRAQTSRRTNDGPTLREGLADLIPTRLFTRSNAVIAAGIVAVCGIVWLLMPGYKTTTFRQLGEMRQTVQSALDDPMASNNWANAMDQLKPDIVGLVERMQDEATADDPPSQVLLWATTEMNAVIGGSRSESEKHLEKFDSLIAEYTQLTTGESPDGSETGVVELPGGLR